MSWNPQADQEDVLNRSGVMGGEALLITSEPRIIDTSVSNGSADYKQDGVLVNPSATADEYFTVRGLKPRFINGLSVARVECFGQPLTSPPYTDDFEMGLGIGAYTNGINGDVGAYIDFTTEEYHVASQTKAATLPAKNDNFYFKFEMDFDAGETRIEQKGGVEETVVFDVVEDYLNDTLINAVSNGSGDEMQPQWARWTMEF